MSEPKSVDTLLKEGFLKKGSDPSLLIKRLPIGIPALDELLGGGVPLGRCIESYGPESTGKTLIAQYIVAAVQKSDKPLCLYLDMERCFDEEWWKQSGVDTDKLLVSSPATAEEAIDVMVAMLESSNDLGIIVLDSIPAMVPAVIADPNKSAEEKTIGTQARLVTLMYSKMKHQLAEKDVVFLATNQMRDNIGGYDELGALPGGKAQRHYNQIILRTKREGWIKENNKNVGFVMEIISRKNKTCGVPDGTSITLPFMAAGQIDMMAAYIEDGIKSNLITKAGPYFKYSGKSLLGMTNLRQHFADNQDAFEELKSSLESIP